VVYAALGGMFFLLVAFLQISLHYPPISAGAALLPQTVLMLLLRSFATRGSTAAHRTAGSTSKATAPPASISPTSR